MKKRQANDESSIRALLDYLNVCHDGSLRRISFSKPRELNEKGDLVYLCDEVYLCNDQKDFIGCDVEIELLLNSYAGALPKQVVILLFEEVRSFRFFQENTFDYSDIYEVTFSKLEENGFEFVFHVRPTKEKNKIAVLSIVCPKIICTELDKYVRSKYRRNKG